jgi:hypothetical protein
MSFQREANIEEDPYRRESYAMCRSIKVLRRPDEFATQEEIDGAALQFVRKISGFHKPSMANQEAFDRAVREIAQASQRLLGAVAAKRSGKGLRESSVADQ